MAYDKQDLFEKAKKIIERNPIHFIEDLVALLPCDKTTFYRLFPIESNEYHELRGMIEDHKINTKVKLRKKWAESDNATLQMALMKLIANKDERNTLSQSKVDHTTNGEKINTTIDLSKLTYEQLLELTKGDQEDSED